MCNMQIASCHICSFKNIKIYVSILQKGFSFWGDFVPRPSSGLRSRTCMIPYPRCANPKYATV